MIALVKAVEMDEMVETAVTAVANDHLPAAVADRLRLVAVITLLARTNVVTAIWTTAAAPAAPKIVTER